MKSVVMDKLELLKILRSNLAMYKDLYDSTAIAFKEKYIVELNNMLLKSAGNEFVMYVDLKRPEDKSEDYEVAIKMLEAECRDKVELTEQEFAQCVLNKWSWIGTFYSTFTGNTGYSGISGYSGYSGRSYSLNDMIYFFAEKNEN